MNNLSFLQPVRLSKEEAIRVCVVLVTSSYCIKTVEELQKRLKSEVSNYLSTPFNLDSQHTAES